MMSARVCTCPIGPFTQIILQQSVILASRILQACNWTKCHLTDSPKKHLVHFAIAKNNPKHSTYQNLLLQRQVHSLTPNISATFMEHCAQAKLQQCTLLSDHCFIPTHCPASNIRPCPGSCVLFAAVIISCSSVTYNRVKPRFGPHNAVANGSRNFAAIDDIINIRFHQSNFSWLHVQLAPMLIAFTLDSPLVLLHGTIEAEIQCTMV